MSDLKQDKTLKRDVFFILLVLLSLLSGVIVFLATTNGPLGYSDSVAYLVSARNLIKGIGLGMFMPSGRFVVTYLHPPLYPLVLTGIGALGVDLVDAARWCNIILGVLTVFTTGYVFLRHSRYPELALMATGLTLFFPTILTMFMSAMSETLFLFLLSLGCLLLLSYLKKETTIRFVFSALICGLLPITRYVGVAVIIPAVICIFLFSSGYWQERLKRAIVFGFVAGIPLMIWLAILYFSAGRALGGRSIQIDGAYLTTGFQTYQKTVVDILWSWIPFSQRSAFNMLHPVRGSILLLVLIIIALLMWVARRRLADKKQGVPVDPDIQLSVFFGVGTASYFVVFMGSWLFTLPQTPINERLLMPLYFVAVLGLISSWAVWRSAWLPTNLLVQLIPGLLAFLLIYWYSPQIVDVIRQTYKNDTVLNYRWRDSQIIRALNDLPAGRIIISNKSETVALWADHPAYDLLENLHPDFIKQTSSYGSDETDSAQRAFRQGAVLVIFDDFTNQFEATYGKRGKERMATIFNGLQIIGEYSDGVIYISPKK